MGEWGRFELFELFSLRSAWCFLSFFFFLGCFSLLLFGCVCVCDIVVCFDAGTETTVQGRLLVGFIGCGSRAVPRFCPSNRNKRKKNGNTHLCESE